MAERTIPPYRADHVGSLLRPAELLHAREQHAAGQLSAEQLRAAEDDAIRGVVKMQEDVGLQSVTDGELRRASWHMDFIYQLGGITTTDQKIRVTMRNAAGEGAFTSTGMAVTGKIRLEQPIKEAQTLTPVPLNLGYGIEATIQVLVVALQAGKK